MLSFDAMVRALVAQDVPLSKARDAAATYATPTRPVKAKRVRSADGKAFDFAAMKFKLLCQVEGLPIPVVDYRFASHLPKGQQRNFELDFAWPNVDGPGGYAIEVQGGIWRKGGGAHQGKGHLRDMEKLNMAQSLNWHVDQVVPRSLCTETTIALVREALSPPSRTSSSSEPLVRAALTPSETA